MNLGFITVKRGGVCRQYTTSLFKYLKNYIFQKTTGDRIRYLTSEKLIPQTPVTTTDPQKLMKLLEQIRQSGVCVSRDEDEFGFTCIASPITGKDGKAIASVSISGTNTAMNMEGSHYKEMVMDTAKKISMAL